MALSSPYLGEDSMEGHVSFGDANGDGRADVTIERVPEGDREAASRTTFLYDPATDRYTP